MTPPNFSLLPGLKSWHHYRLVNDSFTLPDVPSYCEGMIEPQSDPMVSTEEEVEVDAETAAAIDRGIRAANEGRVISSEEVRKLIPPSLP